MTQVSEISNQMEKSYGGFLLLPDPSVQNQLLFGKNRLFIDCIMQEMAPHSLGYITCYITS